MREVTNGLDTILIENQAENIYVLLRKVQYDADMLGVIRRYVSAEETQEGLVLTYTVPDYAISLAEKMNQKQTKLER